MELYITPYIDQLLQLFLLTLKDADDEVISNSVFAIGVLAESGREGVAKYPFSEMIKKQANRTTIYIHILIYVY